MSSVFEIFFRVLGVCGMATGDCLGVEVEMQVIFLAKFPVKLKSEKVSKTALKTAHSVFNASVTSEIIYQAPALRQVYMVNLDSKRTKVTVSAFQSTI